MISSELIKALKHKVEKLQKDNDLLTQCCEVFVDVELHHLKQIKVFKDEISVLQKRILELQIEEKKTVMYESIKAKGIMDPETIKLSEELDVLIVERMKGGIKASGSRGI